MLQLVWPGTLCTCVKSKSDHQRRLQQLYSVHYNAWVLSCLLDRIMLHGIGKAQSRIHGWHACRVAEKLAAVLGTSPALPSRAGSAMLQALAHAASSNGHSYMTWDQLQPDALRLMSASGQPPPCPPSPPPGVHATVCFVQGLLEQYRVCGDVSYSRQDW